MKRSNWTPPGTVTISAPAAEVRKANYKEYRGYDYSNGTSYATAFMAGVAALWLSCHYPNGYRGTRYAYLTFMEHVRRTARKVPGIGPGLFGIVNAGALMTTEPQRTAQGDGSENTSDLTASGEVARLLCAANMPGVKTLLAKTLQGDSAVPTDGLLKTLEPWIDEVVFILRDHLPLRKELSKQAADSAIPAAALRETLIPYASTVLRHQLAGAAGSP